MYVYLYPYLILSYITDPAGNHIFVISVTGTKTPKPCAISLRTAEYDQMVMFRDKIRSRLPIEDQDKHNHDDTSFFLCWNVSS